jgi:hypothetical protein
VQSGKPLVTITATGAQPAGIVGPAWADTSARTETVLNPLRVQDHVRRTVGVYVPGITSVTAHARYYGLHPWLASYAANHDLTHSEFLELVRRCEVTIAWASANHSNHLADLPVAHGRDALVRHISGDMLNVAAVSRRGQYSASDAGFLGTAYRNPETSLGLLDREWRAGSRFTAAAGAALDVNLDGLIDTARFDSLSAATARDGANVGWCICQARVGGEGVWLRDLFAGRMSGPPSLRETDLTRRDTIRLLARAITAGAVGRVFVASGEGMPPSPSVVGTADDPEGLLRAALLFSGPLEQVPAAAGLVDYAEKWRGLLLRHYTVTAWRRLWGHVVDAAGSGRTAREIGEVIGAKCVDTTVGEFANSFATIDGETLLPAEETAQAENPGPAGDLAVLCISAQRTNQLSRTAAEVFGWDSTAELGPEWIAAQLDVEGFQSLAEWACSLCELLLARAQRIGLDKFRVDETDGRAVVPAQVLERDGYWYKSNEVGTGPLGLRITPLATILAGAGVLDHAEGVWTVSQVAEQLGLT